ncbi:hypothetical protein C8A05DRAFT_29807 [Staphylotrichum tortipilum]|uniref:Uncharacterized protein n=1 Tax=Staphylotrichum tortipilum TaxID=2831512 RepID=A0AAN6RXD3_9PEZI|nr:hypothetical protein C8A05DRAFT_29807 [Staphylotrichum longicolle]
MKHTTSLLLAAATAGATLAAAAESTTVVQILIPMVDAQAIDASVISAGPTATSYFLACPSGAPSDECGLASGLTVLYGPSTMEYAMSFTTQLEGDSSIASYSATVNCKLNPAKQKADCTGSLNEDGITTTLSETIPNYTSYVVPITVTAGADKLSGNGGDDGKASATEGAGSGSAKTTMSTATVPTGTAGGASGSAGATGATGAAGSSSSSSTAGGARATQAAAVVVAAVAAAGAVMM